MKFRIGVVTVEVEDEVLERIVANMTKQVFENASKVFAATKMKDNK